MLKKGQANYQLRQMSVGDLNEVLNLQTVCALGKWSKADFENELSNPSALLYIISENDVVLGFAQARLITPIIEILNIGVLPEMRKRGIGKILLQKLFEVASSKGVGEIWLEVRESNLTAREFYHSQGYKIVGRRRNYYSSPDEDAVLMTFIFSDKNPKK